MKATQYLPPCRAPQSEIHETKLYEEVKMTFIRHVTYTLCNNICLGYHLPFCPSHANVLRAFDGLHLLLMQLPAVLRGQVLRSMVLLDHFTSDPKMLE